MITKIGLYRDPRKKKTWVVRWFGESNSATDKKKRYSRSFKIKRDAEAFMAEQAAAFQKGRQRDKLEDITLESFCDDWLATKSPEIRHGSKKLYRASISRLLNYFGPDKLLLKVTPIDAARFIAELKPVRTDLKDQELSNWTRHRELRNCKTMFQSAVTWKLISKNPFKDAKAPKLIVTPWYYVKPKEYQKLSDAAPTLYYKVMYALGYTAGLRFGEMFSLMWHNIDFESGEVKIDNRPATPKIPPFLIKDYETRRIPLPKHTLDMLLCLHAEAPEGVPFVLLDEKRYKTVLAKWQKYQREKLEWENQDMVNNVRREFKRHLKWAEIKPIGTLSIHTLRKCSGKNWADHLPPNVTKELMGHSNIATTMKYYSQVDKDQRKKAAAVVDALISSANRKRSQTVTEAEQLNQSDAGMTPEANFDVKQR